MQVRTIYPSVPLIACLCAVAYFIVYSRVLQIMLSTKFHLKTDVRLASSHTNLKKLIGWFVSIVFFLTHTQTGHQNIPPHESLSLKHRISNLLSLSWIAYEYCTAAQLLSSCCPESCLRGEYRDFIRQDNWLMKKRRGQQINKRRPVTNVKKSIQIKKWLFVNFVYHTVGTPQFIIYMATSLILFSPASLIL